MVRGGRDRCKSACNPLIPNHIELEDGDRPPPTRVRDLAGPAADPGNVHGDRTALAVNRSDLPVIGRMPAGLRLDLTANRIFWRQGERG